MRNVRKFKNKVVVVTGGAHGIGQAIVEDFRKEGAVVEVIDKTPGTYFVGDIGNKETLEAFSSYVLEKHSHIDYLINNALLIMKGIDECSYEEFQYALSVGVTAPFYLTKLFKDSFNKGAVIVNISSSRDCMSQANTESYTAAKGGITALIHALMMSLRGHVRVNSISPGRINTHAHTHTGPDAYQQPSGRVGNPQDISSMVLFLCSPQASFINGENICIDGGMTKQMICHEDAGWYLEDK
ncbi:SDR family oxidoreductase [Catenibacterium mitsuokai]|uniref:SDR family oxidoreductase n=1 Tax=Catenibacterium mitsuokai TaxID=100886 RepID=UPI001FD586F7|nr:SDR family oxidoreductase [Catenibacterium mitsuokai]MBT9814793.1 SDR family oxidoreductase [Catenibacterium mitsuokai]